MAYTNKCTFSYRSRRYSRAITVSKGFVSDGATGAIDIFSDAWWVHDVICSRGTWDDGTPITRNQAAMVLHDILKSEGRWLRAIYWTAATWLLGCSKVRGA